MSRCDICSILYKSKQELFEHELSLFHHLKFEEITNCKHHCCTLCNKSCYNLHIYSQHLRSDMHRQNIRSYQSNTSNTSLSTDHGTPRDNIYHSGTNIRPSDHHTVSQTATNERRLSSSSSRASSSSDIPKYINPNHPLNNKDERRRTNPSHAHTTIQGHAHTTTGQSHTHTTAQSSSTTTSNSPSNIPVSDNPSITRRPIHNSHKYSPKGEATPTNKGKHSVKFSRDKISSKHYMPQHHSHERPKGYKGPYGSRRFKDGSGTPPRYFKKKKVIKGGVALEPPSNRSSSFKERPSLAPPYSQRGSVYDSELSTKDKNRTVTSSSYNREQSRTFHSESGSSRGNTHLSGRYHVLPLNEKRSMSLEHTSLNFSDDRSDYMSLGTSFDNEVKSNNSPSYRSQGTSVSQINTDAISPCSSKRTFGTAGSDGNQAKPLSFPNGPTFSQMPSFSPKTVSTGLVKESLAMNNGSKDKLLTQTTKHLPLDKSNSSKDALANKEHQSTILSSGQSITTSSNTNIGTVMTSVMSNNLQYILSNTKRLSPTNSDMELVPEEDEGSSCARITEIKRKRKVSTDSESKKAKKVKRSKSPNDNKSMSDGSSNTESISNNSNKKSSVTTGPSLIVKQEPNDKPKSQSPFGIDAMIKTAEGLLMNRKETSSAVFSTTTTTDTTDDSSSYIPSPNRMSPHATCCFKHQDGSFCVKDVTEGQRLCDDHRAAPDKLKLILGLSPKKKQSSLPPSSTESTPSKKSKRSRKIKDPVRYADATPKSSVSPKSDSQSSKKQKVTKAVAKTSSSITTPTNNNIQSSEILNTKVLHLIPDTHSKPKSTDTGLIPKSNTGLIPKSNTGLIPKSDTGLIPMSDTGLIPMSDTGLIPMSDTGLIPMSDTGLIPMSDTGLIPFPGINDSLTESMELTCPQESVRGSSESEPRPQDSPISSPILLNVTPALLKDELKQLNKREERVQTALVESETSLTQINIEINDIQKTLQNLNNTRNQLLSSCDELTREYQEVLSLKQSLLLSKCVPKYISNIVKKEQSSPVSSPQSKPHSHSSTPEPISKLNFDSPQLSSKKKSDSRTKTEKQIPVSKKLSPSSILPKEIKIDAMTLVGGKSDSGSEGKIPHSKTSNAETLKKSKSTNSKNRDEAKSENENQSVSRKDSEDKSKSENRNETIILSPVTPATDSVKHAPTRDEIFFQPHSDDLDLQEKKEIIPSFDSFSQSVLCMKILDDKLYACSSDKTIRSYCLKSGKIHKQFQPHQKAVTCLDLYHGNQATFLLSGSSDKLVHMSNVETSKIVAKFKCTTRVMYLVVHSNLLYIAQHSGVVAIINLETRKLIGKQKCHEQDKAISSIAVSDSLLFTAAFDNTVVSWDVTEVLESQKEKGKFKSIKTLRTFSNTVLCMKVHNGFLFCGSADKSLQVYDIKTWQRSHSLRIHNGAVTALEIMGKVLVTSCFDKMIRCFDLERLELLQVYSEHDDMIFSLATKNGAIYSGSRDGCIRGFVLDLTKFYKCKWSDCQLQFGKFHHLKEHIKSHCLDSRKGPYRCLWKACATPNFVKDLHQHIQDAHLLSDILEF